MKRRTLFLLIQLLIVLSPIPFGFVGRVLTPVFFIFLLTLSFLALHQPAAPSMPPYWRGIRWLMVALFVFLLFQVVPLPWSLVELLSPQTASTLLRLRADGHAPAFHSLSLVPLETLYQMFRWLSWAVFFYSLLRLEYAKKEIVSLLHAVLASGLLQLAIAFIKYANGNRYFFVFFHSRTLDQKEMFLTGTIANADHFAFFLELVFPIAAALFLSEFLNYQTGETWVRKILYILDENKRVLLYLIVSVAIGTSILLTGARAGIMAFIVSSIVFVQMLVYFRMPVPMRNKIRYVAVAMIVLVILIGFRDTFDKFFSASTVENVRLVYWSNALRLLKIFPIFGCGFGTFKFAYFLRDPIQSGWLTHAHNEYVETLAEGGILGTLILVALFVLVIFSIFRTWVSRQRPDIKMLGLGILISFLAAILHMAFEFAMRVPANTLLLMTLAILGLRIVTYKKGSAHDAK